MAIYKWNEIGLDEITNLYLYGTINRPLNLNDDSLIRAKEISAGVPLKSTLQMDAVSFMGTGPGRFVRPSMSALISRFLTDSNENFVSTGVVKIFSKAEVMSILKLGDYILGKHNAISS